MATAWWRLQFLPALLFTASLLLLFFVFPAVRSEPLLQPAFLKLPDTTTADDDVAVAVAVAVDDVSDSGAGDGSSSLSVGGGGKRKLLALPSPTSEGNIIVVAFLDGSVLLVDGKREAVHGSFFTGGPLATSYQAFTHDDSVDGYLFCGDDWTLYEYTKDFGKKKLEITAEEYVNMTPLTCVDGGHLLGSTKSTEFLFDAKTGELISSYWMDDFQGSGHHEDNKSVVPKYSDSAQSYANDPSIDHGIFYIIRKDYNLKRYNSLRRLLWNMSVSYIEARSCIGGNCEEIAVYPLHTKNPFPTRLGRINQFELPAASVESVVQHESHPKQDVLALDMPISINERVGLKKNNNSMNTDGVANFKIAPRVASFFFSWYYVICLPLLVLLYKFVRKSLLYDKQTTDLFSKKTTPTKKRKARKVSKSKSHSPSNSDDAETDEQKNGSRNGNDSLLKLLGGCKTGDGKRIGKLFVSNIEIAKGSNGTVVFEGIYDGRSVAVKRLVRSHHDVASKEIQNLIASDQHPNIIRWFGVEYDSDFVYLSLERCTCSLDDLIQSYLDSTVPDTTGDTPESATATTYKIKLSVPKKIDKDVELWKENGCPSSHMIKLMRDVVLGLAHLHELGIIHRDIKPQNVLVNSNKMVLSAKLSDMGISKHLPEEMSSLGHHATGHGSTGWQAPEQLLHGRQTRSVDLFSLGCVLFFCITKGKHPYGSYFERDANILSNRYDLFLVEHIPEAVHLFSSLLNTDPDLRLKATDVLQHPLFWDSEARLFFLRDTSDRFELEDRNGSELLQALERTGTTAFGGKWGEKLDAPFIIDIGRYRKYKYESTRDLLRVIRNKMNHYQELPKELKEILGSFPEGFDNYFSRRFPKLLIEVYKVVYVYCREDDLLKKYFRSTTL